MSEVPDRIVDAARNGDSAALEHVVRAIKDDVYALAIRMLWHPSDAEDATQEILIRVVTHLGSFRGDAAFGTWVYRIAANHLLTTRRRRAERAALSFDAFAADLAEGLDTAYDAPDVDEGLLAEEVKIGCTQGMLLCLDREHRLAYVVGEVFDLPSDEAAYVLDLTPAAYRKRLSRARERVRTFMEGHCGLVDQANACRCRRRVGRAIEVGRIDPGRLLFANHPVRAAVQDMERFHAAAALFRSHPDYRAPDSVAQKVSELLQSGDHSIFDAGPDVP